MFRRGMFVHFIAVSFYEGASLIPTFQDKAIMHLDMVIDAPVAYEHTQTDRLATASLLRVFFAYGCRVRR